MRTYKNEKITITFDPQKCIHSAVCLQALPEVFNLNNRPWVDPDAGEAEEIKRAIDACPSGALQYISEEPVQEKEPVRVEITVREDGPYVVAGTVEIIHSDGTREVENGCALCRCNKSKNKPFCDGSHRS